MRAARRPLMGGYAVARSGAHNLTQTLVITGRP
jgi:hypothetical protein